MSDIGSMFEGATGYSIEDLNTGQTIGGGTLPNLNALPTLGGSSNIFATNFGVNNLDTSYLGVPNSPLSSGSTSGFTPITSPTSSTATPSTPSITVTPSGTEAGSTVAAGSWQDYFLRGVIIILGFIFVAVGLNMFKPGLVPHPEVRLQQ